LAGRTEVIVHSGQLVISFLTICRRKLKLSKIELKKFNGEVKHFFNFWSQFKRIHDDKEMVNEDKFHYLIQATMEGSRAWEIVESFPSTTARSLKA
jgi:hypothetical protein